MSLGACVDPSQENRNRQAPVFGDIRLAAIMACHNRVSSTTRCVKALTVQNVPGLCMDLFVVDDGSSDGTAQAVADVFPSAIVLTGDGTLYWCGAMHMGFGLAIQRDYDFYLWLNDDTDLDKDAVARLIETHSQVSRQLGDSVIIVGSVRDPRSGALSYGGWRERRGRLGSKSWEKVPPDMGNWLECDTINGNCVLVPRAVVQRIGNLDPVFRHSMGDMDYGLRAHKKGCATVIAPGYYGTCEINDGTGSWTDIDMPLRSRWRKLLGPKGLPIKEWGIFSYRHKGPLWILVWLSPYIVFWFKAFTFSLRGGR